MAEEQVSSPYSPLDRDYMQMPEDEFKEVVRAEMAENDCGDPSTKAW